MNLENIIKTNLMIRGFDEKEQLDNRGLIGATIDETVLAVLKNLNMPVVTNPVKLNTNEPFTKEEAEIMDLLVQAHNKFIGLSKTNEMETAEWIGSFHKLQDLLGARVLRRDYPETFHSI